MKIKYLGPSRWVNVGEFGRHMKGKTVDYPEEVAKELLATMNKQEFEAVGKSKTQGKKE